VKLTWRKEPNETGLSRVTQGPRGAILKLDGEDAGHVAPFRVAWHTYKGWYWYAGTDDGRVPRQNTASDRRPYATIDEAKAACETYVRMCLKNAQKEAP